MTRSVVQVLHRPPDKQCGITACGRLAQLARASRLHREGRGFESLSAHHKLRIRTPEHVTHSQLQLITRSSYERVFFMSSIVGVYAVCGILLWSMIRNRISTKYELLA